MVPRYRRRLAAAAALAAIVLAAPGAQANTIAILQGLDKTTARISTIEAPLGQSVQFGVLRILVRACIKRPPEEPPETTAFLEIDEVRPGEESEPQRLFSGWMFKSSPALSALEHPVYDVGVLDCKEDSGSPGSSSGK
jgi:hypothetical protein